MSNVFLPVAIRSCCKARVASSLNLRSVLESLRHLQSATRAVRQHPCLVSGWNDSRRLISTTSILQARNKKRKAATQPSSVSNIDSAPTQASHREGILVDSTRENTDNKDNNLLSESAHDERWRDYDPAGGLPLPDGELSKEALKEIFGDIDQDLGNYILSVMQWRRMSGALIDIGIDFPRDVGVSRQRAFQGLEYLRQTYPNVDEQELGTRWAAEETEKMREALQERAVGLRLYKPMKLDQEEIEQEEEVIEPESQQGTEYGRERSGTSAAQGLLAALKARRIERDEKRVLAQAVKERSLLHAARGPLELGGGVQRTIGIKRYGTFDVVLREPDSVATLKPIDRAAWVQYYEQHATITKDEGVPQLSTLRRLGPSFLLMLLTVGFCFYLAENYTPPPQEARLFPGVPPSVATIGAVSALIVGAFVLSRFPPLWRLNNKYFCIVPAYPFALSNLGAILRHDNLSHITVNVLTLWLVGLSLHEDVGRGTFLAIMLGTGSIGSFSALAYNVVSKNWAVYIFGASGAVLGVLGALCTVRPNGIVNVFGYELPFAAWVLLLFAGGTEIIAIVRRQKGNTDHISHLAGLATGAASGMYLRQRWKQDKTHMHAETSST